jgi:ferritin-like metal-binding protein YciE
MNKLINLEALFLEELRDIYHAEMQLVKALPKIARKVSSDKLCEAIENHLEETKTHVERIEQVFELMGQPAKSKKCEAMQGLLEEGEEILSANAEPPVKDAGIICAAQKVEHYEIASYGCLRTFAALLRREDVAALLNETLEEEKHADHTLTNLAESEINVEACACAA